MFTYIYPLFVFFCICICVAVEAKIKNWIKIPLVTAKLKCRFTQDMLCPPYPPSKFVILLPRIYIYIFWRIGKLGDTPPLPKKRR